MIEMDKMSESEELKEKQEYYYNGGYVTIWAEVEGKPNTIIVAEVDGDLHVAHRNNLVKKEDSYYFKKAQERENELRLITQKAQDNLNKLTEKLVDKAIIALASRIKFSAVFGSGGSAASYAIMLSQELEKMIKEKAPEVMNE
jgi:hypothetical protein